MGGDNATLKGSRYMTYIRWPYVERPFQGRYIRRPYVERSFQGR